MIPHHSGLLCGAGTHTNIGKINNVASGDNWFIYIGGSRSVRRRGEGGEGKEKREKEERGKEERGKKKEREEEGGREERNNEERRILRCSEERLQINKQKPVSFLDQFHSGGKNILSPPI